ncbi:MAG TPA: hypothetical protein VJY62_09310 [Bacteroidia bacterium]|nr:hypothetical protein [Bacteroidia bacterium]
MKKNIFYIGSLLVSSNSLSQLSLNGLYFTGGSQQIVTVPNYSNTIDTGNFTIEAWIKDKLL